MGKMRVHELAKEIGIKNNELLSVLKGLGYEVTNHMSTVDDTQVRRVKAHLAGADASAEGAVSEKRIEAPVKGRSVVIRRRSKGDAAKDAKAEAPAEEKEEAAPTVTVIRRRPKAAAPKEEAPAETAAPEAAEAEAPEAPQPPETEEAPPPAAAQAAEAEERAEVEAEEAAPEQPESISPSQARILDKPRIPLSQLRSAAMPTAREPVGGMVDEVEQRKKRTKGKPQEDALPRRRVVTKRQFQMHALSVDDDGDLGRGRRRKSDRKRREAKKTEITTPRAAKRKIRITDVITVGDLAHHMGVKATEVLRRLMQQGVMATVNQGIDSDTAAIIASDYGYEVENVSFQVEDLLQAQEEREGGENLAPRSPVVTVMGHVDHGKTSLLDAIRESDVATGEAGGITQHIGAYRVHTPKGDLTFIDTPGHEAFTAMRARGAQVTDIVVLVVAANDGVMPQTIEALNHAKDAGVPIIVAVNKIDVPDATPDKVRQQLSEHGLVPEAWGGEAIFEDVSAIKKTNIDGLLESILLQAEILDLKASPDKRATGFIVESRLDKGRGPVATVLVKDGTLRVGDWVVAGTSSGRIRAMMDYQGRQLKEAGPSVPVEVLGLSDVPQAGERLNAVKDDKTAKQVAEHRLLKIREMEMARTSKVSLEDLYKQIKEGETQELRLVIKADVQGSIEALKESFVRLSTEEVRVRIIHTAVGAANESDVHLASASNAVIVCFNVRPDAKSNQLAEREGVEIKSYSIIYEAVDSVRKAMEGLLKPEVREKLLGHAEVRQVFQVSGAGAIAGSMVTDGKILRSALARLLRDGAVVYTGKVSSLRRLKDDVREVQSGFECGIGLENYNDIKDGDVIEAFEIEEIARTLGTQSAAAG